MNSSHASEKGDYEVPGLLRPEAHAVLPDQLRDDLTEAVVSLSQQRISSVIDRVSTLEEPLASALRRLVDQFAYTAILNAIEKSARVDGPHPDSEII